MIFRDDEEIKVEMLNNIDDDLDKTPNHFVDQSVAPVAIKFAEYEVKLEQILEKRFVSNMYGKELDMYIYDHSPIIRRPATKATGIVRFIGLAGTEIKIGDLVSSETISYQVIENKKINDDGHADILVRCVESGTIGNIPAGIINKLPKNIEGVKEVVNKKPFTNGFDEETDNSLRERYYDFIHEPPLSGNNAHYRMWAREVEGVGDADVWDLWAGNGTVKIIIVGYDMNAVSEELEEAVYEYIETQRPPGATITVVSATKKNIEVTANIALARGYNIQSIRNEFTNKLEEYRKETAFNETYLSYANINKLLLDVEGVIDHRDLKLNGEVINIDLERGEIPYFSKIELGVI